MTTYNLTSATGVFKTKYVRMSRDMFNSENVVLAKIKRNDSFTGDQALISVPTSFGGGRGSGVIPRANATNYAKMLVIAKKTFSLIEVDNEAIKASQDDTGAFVRLTKEPVKRGVQSWQGNASRILFNDSLNTDGNGGNGRLGRFTTNPTLASANVYNVVIQNVNTIGGYWKQANHEVKDYVNVNLNTATFEITNVIPATRTVVLTQIDGSPFDLTALASGDIYMQNSRNQDPTGLRGVLLATTGTAYNINVGYRWQAPYQRDAGVAGISPDLLNEGMLAVKYNFGETPDMHVTSYVQYRKLLNQLEDQKRYMIVESRNSGPTGKFSFQALEFMSDVGPVPVVAERFVEDDTYYFLNSDFIEMHARPDAGWCEDPTLNGSIFRLSPTNDTWQARYNVYYENAHIPTAHGILYNLATA